MLANLPAGLLSQGNSSTPGMASGCLLVAVGSLVTAAATGASGNNNTRITRHVWITSAHAFTSRAFSGYRTLLVGALLSGGGEACFNLSTQAHVRNAVGKQMHGRTLSVLAAIPRWATVCSPVLGSALVSWIGWSAPFVALAALSLTALAVVLAAPTSVQGCAASRVSSGGAGVRSPAVPRFGGAALAAGSLRIRATAAAHWRALSTGGLAAACLNALRAVRALYIPLHGANLGLTKMQIGWAVTLGFALDSLLIVPSGMLMDRKGRKLTGVPAFLLLAVGIALIPSAQTPQSLAAIGALLGCGNGLSAGISGTLAADFSPPAPNTGAFLGLWRFVADAGSLVGPVVAGFLSERTSLSVAAHCVGLLGLGGAAFLSLAVPETGVTARVGERRVKSVSSRGGASDVRRAVRGWRRSLAAWLRGSARARRSDGLRLLNV